MRNKEGWKFEKLGNVCEILDNLRKPVTKKDRLKGIYPYYGATGIQDYVDNFIFDGSFVLVGEDGARWGANDNCAFIVKGKCWVNNHAHVLKINKYLLEKWVVYFLNFKDLDEYISGAVIRKLNQAALRGIKIPVPPLPTQQQIVSELDALSDIISKKKQQLAELDKLAQATFYDMFGDPVTNEKGWEKGILKDHTTKIGSGATPSGGNQSYKSEGISLIRSMNVHNGIFKYKDLAFIDQVQAKQLNNVTILENDVLINITGASVARSCIVPKTILPARVNQHVSIIRLKSNLNHVFVNSLFISHSYQEKLLSLGKSNGATREAITKSQLEKLEIPLPPISYQMNFSQKIRIIETQKALINKSIEDVQQLFDYTMDKYFN